jgi:pimeloyl-ACP methyl ester carboxylesterase
MTVQTVPRRARRRLWPWLVALTLAVLVAAGYVAINYVAARSLANDAVNTAPSGPPPPGTSEVMYDPAHHVHAWFAPPRAGRATVVLVHGYNANRADRSDVAAALRGLGYGTLQIDLGYESGARKYGGGGPEAAEIARAVTFTKAHTHNGPVVLLGYSAGGTAAILAAAQGAPVAAVVADSAPSSFLRVATDHTGLPGWVFALTPTLFGRLSPHGRLVDLAATVAKHRYTVPTLIIQGDADRTVSPGNGGRLAALTHGTLWALPGVGHIDAYTTDPTQYLHRLTNLFG